MKKKQSNSVILLSGLLKGYYVIQNGQKYFMDEDYYLCQFAISENQETGKKKTVGLKVNLGIELKDFIKWADTFSNEDIVLNISNFVLNDSMCIE